MKTITKFLFSLALTIGCVGGVSAQEPGNKVYEKDFTSEATYTFYNGGFSGNKTIGIVNDALQVYNDEAVNQWTVQFFVGDNISLKKGANYVVRIGIKGSAEGSLKCVLGSWDDNKGTTMNFTTEAQNIDVTLKDIPVNMNNGHVMLQSGNFVGTLTITKVQVFQLVEVDTYGDAVATADYTGNAKVGWKSDAAPAPSYDG